MSDFAERPRAPFSTDGCGFCSVEPGEPHRHPRCMGIQEDAALCAGGLHTADGGCCVAALREGKQPDPAVA